jgi:tetratricopeptide (TPR) repeat protein
MTRKPYILASILTAALAGSAVADFEPFVAGNAAATTGDHTTAAAAFERAIELHGWSAGALFDLGNAYASSGRPGPAILAYERARLLAPRDRAVNANLDHVREAAGISVSSPTRINTVLATLSSDDWTWIGTAAFAWSLLRRTARPLAIGGIITSVFAMTAAVAIAPGSTDAVIVRSETARIAPTATAEAAFTAPEGENVRIEQLRGEFVYVRDGDRSGWIPNSAVERVIPADRHATRT